HQSIDLALGEVEALAAPRAEHAVRDGELPAEWPARLEAHRGDDASTPAQDRAVAPGLVTEGQGQRGGDAPELAPGSLTERVRRRRRIPPRAVLLFEPERHDRSIVLVPLHLAREPRPGPAG